MPDLMTHMLVGYIAATVLSWRYERISPALVTLVMVGAVSPDLSRIALVLPAAHVQELLGVPWSWEPLHRIGGSILVAGVGAYLVDPKRRRLAFGLIALGAGTHHFLDFLLIQPSGYTAPLWWPITDVRFAFDGIYRSSYRWPAAVSGLLALCVWVVDHQLIRAEPRREETPA